MPGAYVCVQPSACDHVCRGYDSFACEDNTTKPAAVLPTPLAHSNSLLSRSGSPKALSAAAAVAAAVSGPGSPLSTSTSTAGQHQHLHAALPQALSARQHSGPPGSVAALSCAPLAKRNSLPPLRGMPALPASSEPLINPVASAATTPCAGAVSGCGFQGSSSFIALGGRAKSTSCSALNLPAQLDVRADAQPQASCQQSPVQSPTESTWLSRQHSVSLRHQSIVGGQGLGPAAAACTLPAAREGTGLALLSSVCTAQMQLYR